MAEQQDNHEIIEGDVNLAEKFGNLLFRLAQDDFSNNDKVKILLEKTARGVINQINAAREMFQNERTNRQIEGLDPTHEAAFEVLFQKKAFDPLADNFPAENIMRIVLPDALPSEVVQVLLEKLGSLAQGEKIEELRKKQSQIGSNTSFWELKNLPTKDLGGTKISLVGENGQSYHKYEVVLKIPRSGIENILMSYPPISYFDQDKS